MRWIDHSAGWLPLLLLAASVVAILWHYGHEPRDPHRRYVDDLARANRRLERSLR